MFRRVFNFIKRTINFYLRYVMSFFKGTYSPSFMLIGAQRSGTTEIFKQLTTHKQILNPVFKELHFFDLNYNKGLHFYLAHFPMYLSDRECMTGEATPYYLFHPHAPQRIYNFNKNMKFLISLRNPVDRALSHYYHECRMGRETLSFEDAIDCEDERLEGELQRMVDDESYNSFAHQHHSYKSRGLYADQLKVWFSLFPKENFHIIKSEDFYKNPNGVIKNASIFLGLDVEEWQPEISENKHKSRRYDEMSVETRKYLEKYFSSYNCELANLLNDNRFLWSSDSNKVQ